MEGEGRNLQLKKFVVSLLTVAMLLGIVAVHPPAKAFPANSIWVEPQIYNATANGKTIGDTFTISVWINISETTPMYGFEYKLRWNDTLIKHVSHTHYEPWTPNFVAKDEAIPGQYWYGASALGTAKDFTGVMKVLDITFEIAYQPYYPEPDLSCVLDLVDTKMGNREGKPILHTAYDGQYIIETITPPAPDLRVTPSELNAEALGKTVGDTVQFNIEILGLAPAWDLYGWEVKLGYDPTLLKVVDVTSGGFLEPFAGPYGTFFTYRDRPEYSYVVMAELFLGTGNTAPYGSGVLATVTFQIIYEEAYPMQASCAIPLFDIKLVSSQMQAIDVGVVTGAVYKSPVSTPPGPAIDVYTERYRWPGYETTNTGEVGVDPLPSDADAFAPQEEATFYAKLMYGGAPEKFKEVSWEIRAPNGEVYYRQSFTNDKGIANITIRMPWYKEYFGYWTVIAKASVAETPVVDTVTFKLGYIIKVTKSITSSPVNRGEEVTVKIWLENIGTIDRTVFITITIYDDVGMPIASNGWMQTVPAGNSEPYEFTLTLADWAHVGKGTVHINLFTAQPSQCGVCYAPEHIQEFQITFIDP